MDELIALLFLAREIAHREHLKTRSFAAHMALGDFYADIVEKADAIAEAYQGCEGKLLNIPYLKNTSKGSIEKILRDHTVWSDTGGTHGTRAVLEGRDPKLLEWISNSGLSVLIADNYAVEAHPASAHSGSCATLPLHEHCLFKLGIHLGELWHLTPLANWLRAHQRSRFLLTAQPLRLPGAVGSPVAPIATV